MAKCLLYEKCSGKRIKRFARFARCKYGWRLIQASVSCKAVQLTRCRSSPTPRRLALSAAKPNEPRPQCSDLSYRWMAALEQKVKAASTKQVGRYK